MKIRQLNENGLTLVELLAATVLMAIFTVFIASLIIQSTETAKKVQSESQFRDEADLIMSSLIKTIYETKKSNIIAFENSAGNSFLKVTNDPAKCQRDEKGNLPNTCNNTLKKIGFSTMNNQTILYLRDEEYSLSNPNISILPDSKIVENGDGSYEVIVSLQYVTKRGGKEVKKKMDFQNIIHPF